VFIYRKELEKEDLGGGVIMQYLGCSNNLNVLHWNIEDGGKVELHSHENEQFGYVIEGGFDMIIGGERKILGAGDSYFIPANEPHGFMAIGETEAIDVFSPFRPELPGKHKDIRPFKQTSR
jgi:quercetin dioxygenase-like cupin family protein